MKLLFSIPPTGESVGDTDFQSHYPRVNKNMDITAFATEIRKVTRDMIIPFVTKEFYDDLATKYHDDFSNMNDEEKEPFEEVLLLLKDAIAEYTIWKLSPSYNVTIGDMGIQESHSSDGLSPAASQWRYKHFHWNVMLNADRHLDMALTYLEENADKFTKFKSARASLRISDSLVRTTKDFEQYIHLNGSRRTFRKLVPSILQVTRRHAIPVLGKAYYEELLEEIREGDLSEENKEILPHIQEVICHHALLHAIPTLAVLIEEDGIFALTTTDGMNTRQLAHESRLQDLKDRAEKDANQAKDYLINFLYASEDDYPTWKDSEAYTAYGDDTGLPMSWGDGGVMI